MRPYEQCGVFRRVRVGPEVVRHADVDFVGSVGWRKDGVGELVAARRADGAPEYFEGLDLVEVYV